MKRGIVSGGLPRTVSLRQIIIIAAVFFSSSAWGQSSFSGGSTGSSLPAGTIAPLFVQSGLIAQYDFNQGSGTALTDVSTNGNNGAFCAAGAAPTWIASTTPGGGVSFAAASSQCITLPSALNAAATIQIYMTQQPNIQATANGWYACPIVGNGTKANTAAICSRDSASGVNSGFNATNGYSASAFITYKGGVAAAQGGQSIVGSNLLTWVQDASADALYIGNNPVTITTAGGTAGQQTSGVYQLGGIASGFINSNSSFWSGQMYYALFYNRKLTAAEIAQNGVAIQQALANRGLVPLGGLGLTTNNIYVIDGDSLPGANGAWLQFAFPATTDGAWLAFYTGISGWGIQNLTTYGNTRDDVYCPQYPGQGNCILDIQIGTNNLSGTLNIGSFLQQYALYIAQRRATGHYTQIWIDTVIDNTNHANKDTMNTALLQSWQSLGATGIVPIGEDPNLGCDSCNLNAFFAADHLHPSAVGQNQIAHIQQPNINRATNGNFTFSSANTYTTTSPAATTITAASESTNTVTLTFAATPASFVPGVDLTIAGVTPAGYNTSASNICHVLTRTATQITCLNSATGLGAGTVFGTAKTPDQQDIDATVILAGSATSPNFNLESCASWVGGVAAQGWDGRVRIKNANTTSPWVITPFSTAETIDGATSLTMPTASSGNNPVVILEAQALAATTGGCVWRRLQ